MSTNEVPKQSTTPNPSIRYPVYQDHAGLDSMTILKRKRDEQSTRPFARKTGGGPTDTFPIVLHLMLEEANEKGHSTIINWQSHGRAFRVFNRSRFEKEVLPQYFQRQSMFTSFQRQLNNYGFLRLYQAGPDQKCYYHEMFLRGKEDLAAIITRQKISNHSVRRRLDPETEPNFNAMEPVTHASNTSSQQAYGSPLHRNTEHARNNQQNGSSSSMMYGSFPRNDGRGEGNQLSNMAQFSHGGSEEAIQNLRSRRVDLSFQHNHSAMHHIDRHYLSPPGQVCTALFEAHQQVPNQSHPRSTSPFASMPMRNSNHVAFTQFSQEATGPVWHNTSTTTTTTALDHNRTCGIGMEHSGSPTLHDLDLTRPPIPNQCARYKTDGLSDSDSDDSFSSMSMSQSYDHPLEPESQATLASTFPMNDTTSAIPPSTQSTSLPSMDGRMVQQSTGYVGGISTFYAATPSQNRHLPPDGVLHSNRSTVLHFRSTVARSESSPAASNHQSNVSTLFGTQNLLTSTNVANQEQLATISANQVDTEGVPMIRSSVARYLLLVFDRKIEESLGKQIEPDTLSHHSCSSTYEQQFNAG